MHHHPWNQRANKLSFLTVSGPGAFSRESRWRSWERKSFVDDEINEELLKRTVPSTCDACAWREIPKARRQEHRHQQNWPCRRNRCRAKHECGQIHVTDQTSWTMSVPDCFFKKMSRKSGADMYIYMFLYTVILRVCDTPQPHTRPHTTTQHTQPNTPKHQQHTTHQHTAQTHTTHTLSHYSQHTPHSEEEQTWQDRKDGELCLIKAHFRGVSWRY